VAEQFPYRPDVVTIFEEMSGERVPERVAGCALHDAATAHGLAPIVTRGPFDLLAQVAGEPGRSPWPAGTPATYFDSGSGRSWKWKTLLVVPLPVSM
jgi:hypothetical protein